MPEGLSRLSYAGDTRKLSNLKQRGQSRTAFLSRQPLVVTRSERNDHQYIKARTVSNGSEIDRPRALGILENLIPFI